MRRSLFVTYSVVCLLVFGVFTASAHAPTVVIEFIDGRPVVEGEPLPIVVPFLPFTVTLEGTVTHDRPLRSIELSATDNNVLFYGPETILAPGRRATVFEYSVPWTIESAGQHVLTVSATHEERRKKRHCHRGHHHKDYYHGIYSKDDPEFRSGAWYKKGRKCEGDHQSPEIAATRFAPIGTTIIVELEE